MAPPYCRTIREVVLYHLNDCLVFEHLLRLGRPRDYAQIVTALWMYLERTGFDNLVFSIMIERGFAEWESYLNEADFIIRAIGPQMPPPTSDLLEVQLPLTCAALPPQDRNFRFFYEKREVMSPGVTEVLKGEGRLVCNDTIRKLVYYDWNNPALGQQFDRRPMTLPEQDRTMLFNVDVDFLLTGAEIHHFFSIGWGLDCVDYVLIDAEVPGARLRGGRVVFRTAEYLNAVLHGYQQVQFAIRSLFGYRPTNYREPGQARG